MLLCETKDLIHVVCLKHVGAVLMLINDECYKMLQEHIFLIRFFPVGILKMLKVDGILTKQS